VRLNVFGAPRSPSTTVSSTQESSLLPPPVYPSWDRSTTSLEKTRDESGSAQKAYAEFTNGNEKKYQELDPEASSAAREVI